MKKMKMKKSVKKVLAFVVALFAIIMLLPTNIQNPVEGCGKESYHPQSFWHPWGDHNHRGIDIFAKKGTKVHPAIGGIVVATAHNMGAGGNCIFIFSSGFRLHYYAHLSEIDTHIGAVVTKRSVIGTVGNTANYETFDMPHVRLMTYKNGKPVNPENFVESLSNDNK